MIALIIAIAVPALLIFLAIGSYNGLVSLRNRFKNGFAQIDVQLQRRYDLIPNLVETAKAYLAHEKDTLEAVIAARNAAQSASRGAAANPDDPEAMKKLVGAEGALGGVMGRFMMLTESYHDLKGNQNMMQLTEELTSTENKISFARQSYNDSVTSYNTKRESFPSVILAGMFNFREAELFKIEEAQARVAPKVSF